MIAITKLIRKPEFAGRLKTFRPQRTERPIPQILVPAETDHATLVGTAFDCLLRFELRRRAQHAVLCWRPELGLVFLQLAGEGIAEDASCMLAEVKAALATYLEKTAPTREEQSEIAVHALRLANVQRAGIAFTNGWAPGSLKFDGRFAEVDPADVRDLVSMLSIVPFDQLVDRETMFLGGIGSGHATPPGIPSPDFDLISGRLLVDFKTTSKHPLPAAHLDQILVYLIVILRCREYDPTYPEIDRLGLYYSRHGYLWSEPAATWTERPGFQELQDWFWDKLNPAMRHFRARRDEAGNWFWEKL